MPWVKFAGWLAFMLFVTMLGGAVSKHGLFSEQTAAWVQAFGGIGAIAAAAWIAWGEARDRRDRDKRDDIRQAREQRALFQSAKVLLHEAADLMDEVAASTTGWVDPLEQARLVERLEILSAELGAFRVERMQNDQAIELFLRVRLQLGRARILLRAQRATAVMDLRRIQQIARVAAKRMSEIARSSAKS